LLCDATILTNEAFVTFSFNKTSDWLDSLPRAERDKILNDARKQGREAKQKFKDRCLEIERKRFDALKEIALSFTYCFNILCLNLTCAMSALRFSVCFVIDLRISSTAVQLCHNP
jgi:hypothetical protein